MPTMPTATHAAQEQDRVEAAWAFEARFNAQMLDAVQLDVDTDSAELRPQTLAEYIGQEPIKKQITTSLIASKNRGEPFEHTLIYGPPGLGKTTLAQVIAHELGVKIVTASGPALENPADLATILLKLGANDVLFIDEIHRMRTKIGEVLYSAMEDFVLDIVVGKGATAQAVHAKLKPFTLIGATTRAGSLSGPLRDRFGHILRLEYYTDEEIAKIITRTASVLNLRIFPGAVAELAGRSRWTPRIANRLIKRVRDEAQVLGGDATLALTRGVLEDLGYDSLGLDRQDRAYLTTLTETYRGKSVGLGTIAATLSEDTVTLEDAVEPFLLRMGMLERTPRGRKATPAAYKHLGTTAPSSVLTPH